MKRYECKTAQSGFAAGRVYLIRHKDTGEYRRTDREGERSRLEKAVEEMNRKLEAEKEQAGPSDAGLIEAELLLLNGEEFLGEAERSLREENISAPEAVNRAADKLCGMLRESGAEYILERCEDVRGLAAGLNGLIMENAPAAPKEPCILAGSQLSPGELMMIGTDRILGILTETGSVTSHVSVLAGNLGVPYLYGLEGLDDKVRDGDYLILDWRDGSVSVNPPEELISEAEERQAAERRAREEERRRAAAATTRTAIFANISRAEEADGLPEAGADGIGLFRSEFLFLDRTEAPSEEEQFEAYSHAARAMKGAVTVIRTMDIGSDKQAAWMKLPKEINPALGQRGVRVSLEHRGLFRTQLRALLRAAALGSVRIMVPMVASVWELDEVLEEIRTAAKELDERGEEYRIPETGVMIETPAAVMIAPALAGKARFFSIGTNDLTQYTLAVDREAQGLERYIDPMHDALIQMIKMTVDAAHSKGIPVAVCGELAGNPQAVERLIRLGVDELSVSPAKLSGVRSLAADIENRLDSEKKQIKAEGVHAPAEGELIPMEEIPDPVFSGGVMGECVGILSKDGKIYAPLNGRVAMVAATKHAVSFQGDGEEILVHVGLDTMKLGGDGFRVYVREGDIVEQGQLVMEADQDLIRARGFNPMVIVARLEQNT